MLSSDYPGRTRGVVFAAGHTQYSFAFMAISKDETIGGRTCPRTTSVLRLPIQAIRACAASTRHLRSAMPPRATCCKLSNANTRRCWTGIAPRGGGWWAGTFLFAYRSANSWRDCVHSRFCDTTGLYRCYTVTCTSIQKKGQADNAYYGGFSNPGPQIQTPTPRQTEIPPATGVCM